MIGIIKYQAGNLASVSNALERLDAEYNISDDKKVLDKSDAIIFPGVGHAAAAMDDLKLRGLDTWLKKSEKPVLGICLGMQLFFDSSEEGDTTTLGIIPGRLKKFDASTGKVPHMGWNNTVPEAGHPLLQDIDANHFFYFVHSYYAPCDDYTLASCSYTQDFAAIVAKDNFLGVQFHPEKSGEAGAVLLRNFIGMTKENHFK